MTEFKSVVGGDYKKVPTTYFKPNDSAPNTVVVEDGVYNGSATGGQYNTTTHFFLINNGAEAIGVNETGKLKMLIGRANLERGQRARLIYLGKDRIKQGPREGSPVYDWDLQLPAAE